MNRYLEMALGVAMTSKCRQKHGAVVVKHGKVLGVGANVMKNDPRTVDWTRCHIHAEITALKKAGFPRKATVYVARINGKGEARFSRPCPSCAEVLSGLRCKVLWTENDEEVQAVEVEQEGPDSWERIAGDAFIQLASRRAHQAQEAIRDGDSPEY